MRTEEARFPQELHSGPAERGARRYMALPSALWSLSQSLLLLPLLPLREQLIMTAPTNWTSQRSQVRLSPRDTCEPHEYWSDGRCCQLCPAGEYVRQPCSRPHTQGQCEKCGRGTFTKYPNGLDSCLLCLTCSKNEDVETECTAIENRVCKCRSGHFFKAPGNEEVCMPCSTCPKGTVVLQQCNSTADTVCGPPGPESRHRFFLIGSFIVLLLVCVGFVITGVFTKKPMDRGLQSVCSGLPSSACFELEPLEQRAQDQGDNWGPESSGSSWSLHGNQEADPPGPTTEDPSVSACSLDLASEAPMLPSTRESPAGVRGPQATAGEEAGPCIVRPAEKDVVDLEQSGGQEARQMAPQSCTRSRGSGSCCPRPLWLPTRSRSCELGAQAPAQ